ncbi:hypothetical protein LHJ74_28025 [Streptomyces sp. N2-109]|uniref:DUF7848 domain-containing protein n=1 Tax=Streptomyces gossypii TaxID=2883101 RepID=A0ABT2K0B7_9ACTN|nr:hypothetical protein [Streptomyces gossypii]MCT2592975.1 hypothetical protein [Streptomyces gossypii]MCT2593708.1 hypothetical protein [Streptomyces gossypii]
MTRPQRAGRVVTAQTVRVGDTVHVRGAYRTVRNLRALAGGDRLLVFDGGITYRLLSWVPLNAARPQPEPVTAPVRGWCVEPDTRPDAEPVTHAMQCTTCAKASAGFEDPEGARRWAGEHTGRLPTHRSYRQLTRRPWHTTPAPQETHHGPR